MYKTKSHNKMFGNQYRVFFLAVSVMIFLLSLTSAQAAAQKGGKKVIGVVKEMPGIGWPYGEWILDDGSVQITQETVIKGDESEVKFGAKIAVRGKKIDGIFTAYEVEIVTDDAAYATH